MSVADEIKKFKELLDMGAITQEEFDKKKKELIYDNQEITEKEEPISLQTDKNSDNKDESKEKTYNTIKSEQKNNTSSKAINDLNKIIKKVFKGSWTVFRYMIAILFIFVGFLGEPVSLLFGISLLPLTYKILEKYTKDKLSKKNIKTLAIILPIVIVMLLGIFVEPTYLKEAKLDLAVGQNYEIQFASVPEEYKLISSNENIVVVENNILNAKEEGSATIELHIENEVKEKIEINVKYLELSDFELLINNSFDKNSTNNIQINYLPQNASNKQITITSNNEKIAKIENGQLITKEPGECIITATSYNNIVKEYKITVVEPVASVEITEPAFSMYAGDTKNVNTKISPKNATDKTLTWTSSDNNIVSVDNGVLTAKARGSVTITATSHNGISSSCIVNVKEKSPISINNLKYTVDYVGGIEWTFSITNNTDKVINYVILKWNCYNAVGDPIYDQISWENSVSLRYTGPLGPHKNSGTKRNTTKFYNSNYSKANISYVEVIYADGTNTIIQGTDLLAYEGLIK